MQSNPKFAALNDLLARLCDGEMARPDWERLESLLIDDPTTQDYYRRFVAIDVDLSWRAAGRAKSRPGERVWKTDLDPAMGQLSVGAAVEPPNLHTDLPSNDDRQSAISTPPFPRPSTSFLPASSNFVGEWTFAYTVASVFVCLLLLGFWAYPISRDYDAQYAEGANSINENSRGLTVSGTPSHNRPAPVFVGRVTGIAGAKWSDDPDYIAPIGVRVALGRTYKLKSGLMEITYDSGAKVILEGPCDYEVESATGGYLALGKIVARVGAGGEGRGTGEVASGQWSVDSVKDENGQRNAASLATSHSPLATNPSPLSSLPSPLFSVRTPTAVVTDLGTEFGVEVGVQGNTFVHVFQGKVMADWLVGDGGAAGKTLLTEGQAAGFDETQSVVVSLPALPANFTRAVPIRPRRPIDAAAKKTIVKWSGVYRYGDPTKGTSDWVTLERFGTHHVNDGITDETDQGNAYWLGREQTPDEYFIIYLAGRFDVERIELVNTHNGPGNDRGTKDFEIWAADEVDQESELVAPRLVLKGTLPCRFGAGGTIPADVFSAAEGHFPQFQAKYIKFVAKTFYKGEDFGGSGLNEIRVFGVPAAAKAEQPNVSPESTNKEKAT